ncbi:MAG TPA: ABC transporter permease [Candidatus Acidoferrales bacterium]|nr:ABC transporter permease [Candidatus Acidoferrales bacterium]
MSWRRQIARLGALLGRKNRAMDLDEEIRVHLELETEEHCAAGMPAEEARYAARRRFGNMTLAIEESRDMWVYRFVEILLQDIRYGLRMLAKNPGFTVVAVLTLALGIGANTAIFSTINAVLLRPLPFPDSDRLVLVWATDAGRGKEEDDNSYPNFVDLRDQSKSFEAMAAFTTRGATLANGEEAERAPAVQGTPGIFEMFGVAPELGRTFRPEEGEAGASHVVLLSDAFWKERYGGRADALGRMIRVNEEPYSIVGVMPPGFTISRGKPERIYMPLVRDPSRGHGFLMILGRLRPRVSIRAAQADLSLIAQRLEQMYPKQNRGVGVNTVPLVDAMAGDARMGMLVFLGVVTLVLLIACTNVANLLLARSVSRQKEIAVRAALGAGRKRILQQLLAESTVLALAGGALGLLLSSWMARLLVVMLSKRFEVPRLTSTHTDWRVLGFTLAVSLATGIFFGVVFAASAASPNLMETLRESGRSGTESGRGRRLRGVLVVTETAMALVLLSGAGLLLKSVVALRNTAPGFRSENLLTVDFWLPRLKYAHDPERIHFFKSVMDRAQTLAGITSVALVADLPLSGDSDSLSFHIPGKPDPAPDKPFQCLFNVVSPGYLLTMGIPLRAGREFSDQDSTNSPPVVLINESAARRFWPGEDPVGRQINLEGIAALTVVGVAADTRQSGLGAASRAEIFLNYLQPGPPWPFLTMVARTDGDPMALAATLKSATQQVDHDVPITRVRTMDEVLANSLAQPQLFAALLGVFASLALTLAAVGLYGVVSYTVSQRTHEMGIRMALGAERGNVLWLVLRQGLGLGLAGTAIGTLCALAANQTLVHLVPSTKPGDPLTLTAVPALLLLVALAASYIPARRATRVDPVVALRYE